MNSVGVSSYDKTGKAVFYLVQQKISSLKNSAAGRASIKWSKDTKASGYVILYRSGSVKKYVYVKNNATISKTITGLSKGKTYAFYVRSYKTVGGKNYYSPWSAGKNLKISK